LAVIVAALGLGACGDRAVNCTLKGCSSGATVVLPRLDVPDGDTLTVRVCANGRCQDGELPAVRNPDLQADVPVPLEGGSVELSVTVRDKSGALLARGQGTAVVKVTYPNGRDCPPACRRVQVRLADGQLVSA
jgi:hypothetical protein